MKLTSLSLLSSPFPYFTAEILFSIKFIKDFRVSMCFTVQLSKNCFVYSSVFRERKRYISTRVQCCQPLFLFFRMSFRKIKRRRGDLNPRIAFAIYTLSRGASSATWVLLHVRNASVNGCFLSPRFQSRRHLYLRVSDTVMSKKISSLFQSTRSLYLRAIFLVNVKHIDVSVFFCIFSILLFLYESSILCFSDCADIVHR